MTLCGGNIKEGNNKGHPKKHGIPVSPYETRTVVEYPAGSRPGDRAG